MNFSPKCNTKSDIGKFVIKVWEFLTLFGEKQGPITGPKFALGKSLQIVSLLHTRVKSQRPGSKPQSDQMLSCALKRASTITYKVLKLI